MAKPVLDCVTVSKVGVGARSYGQNPVVGVQLVTGVGSDDGIRVQFTLLVKSPQPEQDLQHDCNTTQVNEQPVLDYRPGEADSSMADPTPVVPTKK